MSSNTDSGYRPGTCNIGAKERERRRRWALLAVGGAVAYLALVWAVGLPRFLLSGVFVPVTLAAEWAIESRERFCVRLALRGRYDVDGRRGRVPDTEARRADASTAVRITALASVIGLVVTALVYGLSTVL
ncbi:MAG: hypothetical protein ABEJ35_00045 [Halobacteriaceae archaeon]